MICQILCISFNILSCLIHSHNIQNCQTCLRIGSIAVDGSVILETAAEPTATSMAQSGSGLGATVACKEKMNIEKITVNPRRKNVMRLVILMNRIGDELVSEDRTGAGLPKQALQHSCFLSSHVQAGFLQKPSAFHLAQLKKDTVLCIHILLRSCQTSVILLRY